uniref:Uncharacterized protein n=1 Tax=Ciona savignyi TaxID=51511 RepID=H2YTK0_CIOSA
MNKLLLLTVLLALMLLIDSGESRRFYRRRHYWRRRRRHCWRRYSEKPQESEIDDSANFNDGVEDVEEQLEDFTEE